MTYALINEVWGSDFKNTKSNSTDKNVNNEISSLQPSSTIQTNEVILNKSDINSIVSDFNSIEEFNTTPQYHNIYKQFNVTPSCGDLYDTYMNHINTCSTCYSKTHEMFINGTNSFKQDHIEHFDNNNNDNDTVYTDIICLILVGILIIFAMDSFVRFGKKITIR
jgi:hypothetical protein